MASTLSRTAYQPQSPHEWATLVRLDTSLAVAEACLSGLLTLTLEQTENRLREQMEAAQAALDLILNFRDSTSS